MITNTNTATFTTCDFWRENITRIHDQRCSACRGMFNTMKFIVYIIYSIQIRNNNTTWCKSAHLIFQMKKDNTCCFLQVLVQRHLNASDKSSIVQQLDVSLKQFLTFHVKRKSYNKV